MKKTLITIGLTTVVVLTIIGLVATFSISGSGFSPISRNLGGGYDDYALSEPAMEMAPASAPMPMAAEGFALDSGGGPDMAYGQSVVSSNAAASNTASQADVERKIIKDANLSIVVQDPVQSMDDITALAEQSGGYVVSSNIYQNSYGPNNITVPEGSISIRIPSEKLNDILAQIKSSAVEVQSENVSGQDVTDQYVNLQSRLTAKQATEKKLLEFLDQAEDTEATLAVYNQLQQVQSDIEVLQGQIKYIDQSAALSSVTVNLIAEAGTQPIEIGGWKLEGTAKESVQNLILFTQGFTQFLIRFFLNYLWRILLIGLLLYGAFVSGRAVYRRFIKPKVVAEVKEEKK